MIFILEFLSVALLDTPPIEMKKPTVGTIETNSCLLPSKKDPKKSINITREIKVVLLQAPFISNSNFLICFADIEK